MRVISMKLLWLIFIIFPKLCRLLAINDVWTFRNMALNFSSLTIETKLLHSPPLEEIVTVLRDGMKVNFREAEVEIVECPNLKEAPFHLASSGLRGNPKIVDLGGPPYLLPLAQKQKIYELKELGPALNMEKAFIIGAGAGPFPYAGMNCEGIYNLYVTKGQVEQHSKIAKLNKTTKTYVQESLPDSETRCALLANLYISEGLPGKVLKVHVKKRKGPYDFIASLRTTLKLHYKEKFVGLGGVFIMNEGKARQHIMDDFSTVPLLTDSDVNKWLNFFEMSAPLIGVGTLVSGDMGLDLRVQHFHSFSDHNDAGHYHIDTTPEEVEYLGYFYVADSIHRIDRPEITHTVGRD